MASNFGQYSHNSDWQITPYVAPPVLNGQTGIDYQRKQYIFGTNHFDSPAQGMRGCGLETTGVLAPEPVSVGLPLNIVRPEQQLPIVVAHNTPRRRPLSTAKVIAVSYVSFRYLKIRENPDGYDLRMQYEGSVPEVEETMPAVTGDGILPLPGLLKGWKMETRQRPNGSRDKFYFHPASKRMFRSLVEVLDFIKSSNHLNDKGKNKKSEVFQFRDLAVQGPPPPQRVKLGEASSSLSNDKKRKSSGSQIRSNPMKRRIFPVVFAMKKREQLEVGQFYAESFNNLVSLSPAAPVEPMEEEKKIYVSTFLFEAQQNLLRDLENKKIGTHHPTGSHHNGSPEENDKVTDVVQNPEPSDPPQKGVNPEPQNPQEGGQNLNANNVQARMTGLTDKEKEVVEIFTQGLGRGDNDHQHGEELLDYSQLFLEPIPHGLF